MNFKEQLLNAQEGNHPAIICILEMYQPLLMKTAVIRGVYDEDLYQELCVTLLKCINQFKI